MLAATSPAVKPDGHRAHNAPHPVAVHSQSPSPLRRDIPSTRLYGQEQQVGAFDDTPSSPARIHRHNDQQPGIVSSSSRSGSYSPSTEVVSHPKSSIIPRLPATPMRDQLPHDDQAQREPHLFAASAQASRMESPHTSSFQSAGTNAPMPRPRARVASKTSIERKHWSFDETSFASTYASQYDDTPARTSSTNSNNGNHNKALFRYSSENLDNNLVMVTQQGTSTDPRTNRHAVGQMHTDLRPINATRQEPQQEPIVFDRNSISRQHAENSNRSGIDGSSSAEVDVPSGRLQIQRGSLNAYSSEAQPWVLPPIPSFTELSIRFDRSRTNSVHANLLTSVSHHFQDDQSQEDQHDSPTYEDQDQHASTEPVNQENGAGVVAGAAMVIPHSTRINMDGQGYHWTAPTSPNRHSLAPAMVPSLAPSIFDGLQSDDNTSYIVWSTPTESSIRKSSGSAAGTPALSAGSTVHTGAANGGVPVHPLASRPVNSAPARSSAGQSSMPPPSPSSLAPHDPASSSSSSSAGPRRWSAGETVKGKGEDLQDGSSSAKQHAREESTGTSRTADAAPNVAQPKTSKATLKSGGTPEGAATSNTENASSQPVIKPTTSSSQTNAGESRVIMAATVEKLVEKLTSEIDYTFLTDFFLIYRLFITPMALLNLFILRFQWALIDDSPQRRIVRIRTFVTLRHWLLNYFGFDFMRSKELRQTLTLHLRSLSKHPLVVESMRDQRILKELRRYAQSLKKIHYRNMAQQKLERQSRRRGEYQRRRLQAKRLSLPDDRESFIEWSVLPGNEASTSQHPLSSSRSSAVAHDITNRNSIVSESMTEELAVEFRSSDQSDEEDFELDDSEDDFEPSTDSSAYESEDDSEYSIHGDDEQDEEYSMDCGDHGEDQAGNTADCESDSLSSSQDQAFGGTSNKNVVPRSECHLPSPAFSPPFQKSQQGGSGSFRSQHVSQTAVSSTASRPWVRGARPALPDFEVADGTQEISQDSPSPSYRPSTGGHRWGRAKANSRPLSAVAPVILPLSQAGPTPSARGSVRSIEPYINPPPRSITSTEKKKTWTSYMSATVGRLSKMKSVFSSSSRKGHRHSHSLSSMNSGGSSGKRTTSAISQSRSTRYWQGNRSDPEGEKISHYLLGSCTGMNMLLSSSEERHLSIDRRFTSERDQQREQAGSDWSSDDDYSQYEMTRRSSRQMQSQEDHPVEEHEMMDPHVLETRLEQAQYPPYVEITTTILAGAHTEDGSVRELAYVNVESEAERSVCSECERERERLRIGPLDLPLGDTSDFVAVPLSSEPGEGSLDVDEPTVVSTLTEPNQSISPRRETQRRDPTHRASWATFSPSRTSVFGCASKGTTATYGEAIQERVAHTSPDRFVERLYKPQQDIPRLGANESVQRSEGESGKTQAGLQRRDRSLSNTLELISTRLQQAAVQEGLSPAERALTNRAKRQTMPPIHLNREHYHHHYHHCQLHPHLGHLHEHHHALHQESPRRHSSAVQSMEGWILLSTADRRNSLVNTPSDPNLRRSIHLDTAPHPLSASAPSSATRVSAQAYQAIRPPPHTSSGSQHPVELIRPRFGKGRSKSQPHLLSSLANPQMSALSVKPPQLTSPIRNTGSRTHCQHVRLSQSPRGQPSFMQQAAASSAVPSLTSRAASILQDSFGSGHSLHLHKQPRLTVDTQLHHSLDPTGFSPKEHRVEPMVLRYRSELIAQQLCLIERELLSQVQWYELVDAGWTKKTASDSSKKRESFVASTEPESDRDAKSKSREFESGGPSLNGPRSNSTPTPTRAASAENMSSTRRQSGKRDDSLGIKRLVDRFNLNCQWVAFEIVRTRDLNMRVKVVEKFIRIAHTCYNHSNFSSLIQLMLGLQALSVSRLSQTWARVRAQEMRIMHDLIEFTLPFHNWKHLREAMKSIADEWGGTSSRAATATAHSMPPSADKPSSSAPPPPPTSAVAFFSRRSSKSMASIAKEAVRRPSAIKNHTSDPNTVTISTLPPAHVSRKSSSAPLSALATVATAAVALSGSKGKEKEKDRQQNEKETTRNGQQGGCIPFLGLYLSDLVFNSELPSYVEPSPSPTATPVSSTPAGPSGENRPSLINIHKHRTTATIIKRVLTFRTMAARYPFLPEPEVQELLSAIENIEPTELLRLSKLCEERASDAAR